MIKTIAINPIKNEPMMVTWDLGRRCNYDCTYCESTRHNNYSPYTKLHDLRNTFDFIKEWTNLYNSKRKISNPVNINFTGGEPTVNPDFWNLIDYIKNSKEEYTLGLTTNGSWGSKYSEKIAREFNGVTISYHAEQDKKFKKRVIDNILYLASTNIWLQVNVMLHVDHWQECVDLCELLKSKGIKLIGENLINIRKDYIRHDNIKLSKLLMEIAKKEK